MLLLPHGDSSPLLFVRLFSFLISFTDDPYFPSFFLYSFFFWLSAPVGASERASVGLSSILNHFLFAGRVSCVAQQTLRFSPLSFFLLSACVSAACCAAHNVNAALAVQQNYQSIPKRDSGQEDDQRAMTMLKD